MKFVLATAYSDPLDYLALARGAEANGFEAVAVSDHVVHPASPRTPYPYTAGSTSPEGVTVDAQGNIYGAEFTMDVKKYTKQ